jgi:CBS domain-containing protein
MRHYEVRDVMTADPVAVTPATPIKDLADILVTQRIGAVPVVTPQGRVAGVVAEADLLRKEQLRRDPDGQPWRHLSYRDRRAIATAETAGELMSTHPVTVRPTATTAEAARLMDRHQARCLLVVDEAGKLLGVLSPRDLLRVFLRPDEEIKAEIIRDVLSGYLGTNPSLVRVDVTDGVARLAGEVERKSMLEILLPAVRAVDGVVDVEGQLRYAFDDLG